MKLLDLAPDWALAVLAAALVASALALARKVLLARLRAFSRRTQTDLDDHLAGMVESTRTAVLLVIGGWVGVHVFMPGTPPAAFARAAATLALLLQAGTWGSSLVETMARRRKAAAIEGGDAADATAWTVVSFCARLGIWSLLALVALDNVGIDVTALVAGLGIGGLAIGLAVQNVLGDLLASLAIVLDRPFAIGDFLVVGDEMGTVEHVGLKTTRIRALSGEQIVVSNADLLGSRIRNFKLLRERRVVLKFGVLYEVSPEQLEAIPPLVRRIVEARDGVRFERAHLCGFGESSIDFEAVYHLADPDYTRHMDVQQEILLGLFRGLAELDVGFAYPTRTLWVNDARQAAAGAVPAEALARAEA